MLPGLRVSWCHHPPLSQNPTRPILLLPLLPDPQSLRGLPCLLPHPLSMKHSRPLTRSIHPHLPRHPHPLHLRPDHHPHQSIRCPALVYLYYLEFRVRGASRRFCLYSLVDGGCRYLSGPASIGQADLSEAQYLQMFWWDWLPGKENIAANIGRANSKTSLLIYYLQAPVWRASVDWGSSPGFWGRSRSYLSWPVL